MGVWVGALAIVGCSVLLHLVHADAGVGPVLVFLFIGGAAIIALGFYPEARKAEKLIRAALASSS